MIDHCGVLRSAEPAVLGRLSQALPKVPVQMWAGTSPVPVQMWPGTSPVPVQDVAGDEPGPGADVAGDEPGPGADVARVGRIVVQMWPGAPQSSSAQHLVFASATAAWLTARRSCSPSSSGYLQQPTQHGSGSTPRARSTIGTAAGSGPCSRAGVSAADSVPRADGFDPTMACLSDRGYPQPREPGSAAAQRSH